MQAEQHVLRTASGSSSGIGRWIGIALLGALLALQLLRAACFLLDSLASIRYPYEFDYGEGVAWQQTLMIPGPHMYSSSQELPFIVFHYPPLYYLLVRVALSIQPDFLAAGRLVSSLSAVVVALSVAGLVWLSARPPSRPIARVAQFAIALATGLLVLCLQTVHYWALLMRVDTAALAFAMMGLLAGAWADGRFWGTTVALLICVASVFTKQTELPAGVAVFLIALLRNPRSALYAAVIAATFGLAALGSMEWLTQGGFLHNIIGYNINPISWGHGFAILQKATRAEFPFMALMLVAAGATLFGFFRQPPAGPWPPGIGRHLLRLRTADRATAARALVLLHFTLAGLMLFTVFKIGSYINYLLDWLCVGCVLIAVLLCDMVGTKWRFSLIVAMLILGVLRLPPRLLPDRFPQGDLDRLAALVHRIAAARKPVASDYVDLLMRAGKPMVFEPAIVTQLASVGRWNEGPLVKMIRSGGFAFMITMFDTRGGSVLLRSPAVDAAMREAYPREEKLSAYIWLHLPRH